MNEQTNKQQTNKQKPKSEIAAKEVLNINPKMNVYANIDKICPETEDKYNGKTNMNKAQKPQT